MQKAVDIPYTYLDSKSSLVSYLIEGLANDFEKAKVLHDWIALNIAYDTESFFSGTYAPQNASDVFSSGTAVCAGYSDLFLNFCDLAGLSCETISGKSKGYGYATSGTLGDHAWNAVNLEKQWHLIDTTWDAGTVSPATQEFVFEYCTDYLFLDPALLIYTHFPDDQQWQLLDSPITQDQFEALAYLRGAFSTYAIELIEPIVYSHTVDSEFEIQIASPSDTVLKPYLLDSNVAFMDSKYALAQKANDIYKIDVKFPDVGDYFVYVYAQKNAQDQPEFVLSYKVHANTGTDLCFPTYYPAYNDYSLELIEPQEFAASVGSEFEVSIKAPGDVIISPFLKYTDGDYIYDEGVVIVEQVGTIYIITANFPGSGNYDLIIFVKSDKDEYIPVLKYQMTYTS